MYMYMYVNSCTTCTMCVHVVHVLCVHTQHNGQRYCKDLAGLFTQTQKSNQASVQTQRPNYNRMQHGIIYIILVCIAYSIFIRCTNVSTPHHFPYTDIKILFSTNYTCVHSTCARISEESLAGIYLVPVHVIHNTTSITNTTPCTCTMYLYTHSM